MAYITGQKELHRLYKDSKDESKLWREDYHEYERLADNGLMENLDPNLPETNDGSLAASLYKLPKRIINNTISGRAVALDSDDAWITELANIVWEKKIIPNANSQAPFIRKWKDAVRKAGIYGSVPLITLFVERGDYTGADFIVGQPQDVTLETGKVSDYDSDVLFWDIYLSKLQLKRLLEQAQEEIKDHKAEKKAYDKAKADAEKAGLEFDQEEPEPYNVWFIDVLKDILKSPEPEDTRDSDDDHRDRNDRGAKQKGYKFNIAVQRGANAPYKMTYTNTGKCVREWSNPDPTGDVSIHFLYCYQDFINPYGVGIVKLAGGTQNVLDYMRQADVLATQLGFRPPIAVSGDVESADLDTFVYEQDAIWEVGNADVKRQEISNQIYAGLPTRTSMYKTSLNQLIPVGDTSIAAGSGDPMYSKTPAGVKFQQENLSIDDEDFKDNVDITYAAVAKSMINTHFANMQGSDLLKLSDEEVKLLMDAGLEFPLDENGQPLTNELEVIWDEARANFDFVIDPEADKTKDEEQRREGLQFIVESLKDPGNQSLLMGQPIIVGSKKIDPGELMGELLSLATDNDKIIQDIKPEEALEADAAIAGAGVVDEAPQISEEDVAALMQAHGVSEGTAIAMLEAEAQGLSQDEILSAVQRQREVVNA